MLTRSRRSLTVLAAVAAVALLAWLWPRSDDVANRGEARRGDAKGTHPWKRGAGRDDEVAGLAASGLAFQRALASVSGTITAGGTPLPGASVCAWLEHRDAPSDLTQEPRCTTSSADGRYRLADLPPVSITIGASAPEHVPAVWEEQRGRPQIHLRPGQERTKVDLALDAGGVEVRGIVRDIAGGVVEGAFVTASSRHRGGFTPARRGIARTDAEGRFSTWVAAGDVSVSASAEGYSAAWRSGVAPGFTFELFCRSSHRVSSVKTSPTGSPSCDRVVQRLSAG